MSYPEEEHHQLCSTGSKPALTPSEQHGKLSLAVDSSDEPLSDIHQFQWLIGRLIYIPHHVSPRYIICGSIIKPVQSGTLKISYITSHSQPADVSTKSLGVEQHHHLCSKLSIFVLYSNTCLWGPIGNMENRNMQNGNLDSDVV
ncbi:hypothetical protein Dimus_025520 [Dionaea muscipula]